MNEVLIPVPEYYRMNEEAGKLEYLNRADGLVNDRIVVVITETDGVADPILNLN